MSTIRHADRIIVIDQGQVVEEGDHDCLMRANGLYQDLFEKQKLRAQTDNIEGDHLDARENRSSSMVGVKEPGISAGENGELSRGSTPKDQLDEKLQQGVRVKSGTSHNSIKDHRITILEKAGIEHLIETIHFEQTRMGTDHYWMPCMSSKRWDLSGLRYHLKQNNGGNLIYYCRD